MVRWPMRVETYEIPGSRRDFIAALPPRQLCSPIRPQFNPNGVIHGRQAALFDRYKQLCFWANSTAIGGGPFLNSTALRDLFNRNVLPDGSCPRAPSLQFILHLDPA